MVWMLVSADIPLPDTEAARALLDINLRGVRLAADVDLDALAQRLAGYSGADITNVRWPRLRHRAGPRAAPPWRWLICGQKRPARVCGWGVARADLPRCLHDGDAATHRRAHARTNSRLVQRYLPGPGEGRGPETAVAYVQAPF